MGIRRWWVPVVGVWVLVVAACGGAGDDRADGADEGSAGGEATASSSTTTTTTVGVDDGAGLTGDGVELVGDLGDGAPRYRLSASVDPVSGRVEGTMEAELPVGVVEAAHLRFFPGLLDPEASVDGVEVEGAAAAAQRDGSLLTVPLPAGHRDRVQVDASFAYEVPVIEDDPLGGLGSLFGEDALDPAAIGLLGRKDGTVSLGHWFPVWVPEGLSADPTPDGFGDIGNFPAALIEAEVDVPQGWTLVSGGVRTNGDEAPATTAVEGATGLRDLGMVLIEGAATVEVEAGPSVVRVVAPAGTDPAVLDEVAAEAATSLEALSAAFGAYPWTELDVVSVPLGSGVGGMEWPGMIWIEEGIFAGSLPGLGDLGDLGELGDILGDEGLGDLGLGLDPEVVASTRRWTVAHEVGHEWWHAVVGNDSVLSPAVDEPLAQHSACVVFHRAWADVADRVCQGNTDAMYEQMRMMGESDAPAAQPSDAFTSSLQYGGVVYGKAPGVYDALGEAFGPDAVVGALAEVVDRHAFEQISVEQLQATLGEALGDPAAVEAAWSRWIEQAHGDEDLGVGPNAIGGLGDLGDLDGLDADLAELLRQLLEILLG